MASERVAGSRSWPRTAEVTVDAPGFGDWLEARGRSWPEVVAARERRAGAGAG